MVLLKRLCLISVVFFFMLATCPAFAAGNAGFTPSAKDKCAVCGMFVGKYPAWCARVGFKDKTYAWFDGPRDMFTYLLDLKKYNPGHGQPSIESVQVNDYYTLKAIDGRKAFYVIGSDVNGPMGHELVPFGKMADAQGFLSDHKGKKILRYGEVTTAILGTIE